MNRVTLIGRLGQDPELRYTQGGKPVANFSIATNDRIKQGEEWVDKTTWHRVVIWGKSAEMIVANAKKGTEVFIDGRYESKQWADKEGAKHTSQEVVATYVRPMAQVNWAGGDSGSAPPSAGPTPKSAGKTEFTEDDIPF